MREVHADSHLAPSADKASGLPNGMFEQCHH